VWSQFSSRKCSQSRSPAEAACDWARRPCSAFSLPARGRYRCRRTKSRPISPVCTSHGGSPPGPAWW
jgi:hypothetical protein